MLKAFAAAASLAAVLAAGPCGSTAGPSGGSGANPPAPGHANDCDTRVLGIQLNIYDYPFAAVEGVTESACNVNPQKHSLIMTLWYMAVDGHWSPELPGNGPNIGGICFTGVASPKGAMPGECTFAVPCPSGTAGQWKISVHVDGVGPGPSYIPFKWDLPADEQHVTTITCPIPKQRRS